MLFNSCFSIFLIFFQIHLKMAIFGGACYQYLGLSVCLSACLSVCLFQLASGEVYR